MLAVRWFPLLMLGLGYAVALEYGQLNLTVVVPLGLLIMAGLCVTRFPHPAVRGFGHLLFIALAVGLASHWLPGFHNGRAIAAVRLSPEAVPFSMYLNLDKPLIGAWVLLACPWAAVWFGAHRTLRAIAWVLPPTLVVCLALAYAFGITGWSPKWPVQSGVWMLNNLLLVSITEELLFRGYVQGGLQRMLRNVRAGQTIALLVAASSFGLVHSGGGWQWVMLATLAGIGYGMAWRLGGWPAAVVTHFGLNLAHFALFTYPMLDR